MLAWLWHRFALIAQTSNVRVICNVAKVKGPTVLVGPFTLVTPAGFEPAIAGLRTRSPGPLDEGAKAQANAFCVCIKLFAEHLGRSAEQKGPSYSV